MKKLKTKKEITNWLDKMEIVNYILIEDKKYGYLINVNGNVYINNKNLLYIPVKFNIIDGNFNCSVNQLTSLEGCPKKIGFDFNCSYNQLTSLEGCPNIIGFDFNCSYNQLTSLEGCPNIIDGNFYCLYNKLKYYKKIPNYFNSIIINNYNFTYKEFLKIFQENQVEYEKEKIEESMKDIQLTTTKKVSKI